MSATRILQIGLVGGRGGGVTTLLERKLVADDVGLAAALVVSLLRPELRSFAASVATLGVTLNAAAIWSRRVR